MSGRLFSTGTVSVTNGSKIVTLAGATVAEFNMRDGDDLQVLGLGSRIAIAQLLPDTNQFELLHNFDGATGAALAYTIYRNPAGWGSQELLASQVADNVRLLSDGIPIAQDDLDAIAQAREETEDLALQASGSAGTATSQAGIATTKAGEAVTVLDEVETLRDDVAARAALITSTSPGSVVGAATGAEMIAGAINDKVATPVNTKVALEARFGPTGTQIGASEVRYLSGHKVIGGFLDNNGRMPLAITEEGLILGKLGVAIGVANGLSFNRDPVTGLYEISLGTEANMLPVGGNGDTFDTRSPRYFDSKEVLWALEASNGRCPIVVTIDGQVYLAKSNVQANTDAIEAELAVLTERFEAIVPTAEIACYGDSLTAGSYPSRLATVLDRSVYNRGIGGQTAKQIASRQGGWVRLLTVENDEIIEGSNPVTAFEGVAISAGTRSSDPLSTASNNTVYTLRGTLAGVPGVLSRGASGGPPSTVETYVFAPDAGQVLPVRCPPQAAFIVDPEGDDRRVNIFWPGRNDTWADTNIQLSVDWMVSRLATGEKRFVIMSVLNGEYATEDVGGARYNQIIAINTAVQSKYPANYLDIRRYLIDHGLATLGITPTAQDLLDVERDIVPVSLRVDGIHLTGDALQLVAEQLADFIIAKGW
ncbi:hypothetical protein [Devosia sp. Root635]|uniref:hypothetical protein n=1 Tax=Devosia sp. Root635 TaxID=1736575 RepID=UPI0006F42C46|nr:hypothetical protein [Devosia sp. Root635]KRA44707.1 hypothetical protein ASD80_06075 [Devosia sp. Root635]